VSRQNTYNGAYCDAPIVAARTISRDLVGQQHTHTRPQDAPFLDEEHERLHDLLGLGLGIGDAQQVAHEEVVVLEQHLSKARRVRNEHCGGGGVAEAWRRRGGGVEEAERTSKRGEKLAQRASIGW